MSAEQEAEFELWKQFLAFQASKPGAQSAPQPVPQHIAQPVAQSVPQPAAAAKKMPRAQTPVSQTPSASASSASGASPQKGVSKTDKKEKKEHSSGNRSQSDFKPRHKGREEESKSEPEGAQLPRHKGNSKSGKDSGPSSARRECKLDPCQELKAAIVAALLKGDKEKAEALTETFKTLFGDE